MCGAPSRWRSISAVTATRSRRPYGGRKTIECLIRADLGLGFARRAGGPAVVADEEALPFAAQRFDLVVSAMSLHWVNDLPGTLIQIARILKPDGLFLGAMLGGATLWQLRQALAAAESEIEDGLSPRVSPFADLRDAAGLLQRAGFALPVADSETIDVEYANALELMRELSAMGESNLVVERRRGLARRATLLRAAEIYRERFTQTSGRVAASFDVLFLHGWAPHDSQPKPLKPGSARHRLAEALGYDRAKRRRKARARPLVKLGFGDVLSESFEFFFTRLAALLPPGDAAVDPVTGAAHRRRRPDRGIVA